MSTKSGLPLTGGLMNATIALLGWFGLSSGIYAVLTDASVEGLIWIVLTVGLSAMLLRGKTVGAQENRRVPVLLWLFLALFVAVVGATELYNLFITDIRQLGTLLIPELFQSLATIVFLALVAVFLWQLIQTYRQSRYV